MFLETLFLATRDLREEYIYSWNNPQQRKMVHGVDESFPVVG